MNNADLIVATLKKAGIARGFGIPSGNVLPLIEAMRAGGMDFILTAHEGSAGFAADVNGRITGRPGLAIATLGPGATNLATGVGCAFLDRSPMIAITCNLNSGQLGRRLQMHIDHHALFAPITKTSLALSEGNVAGTVAKAVEISLSEPMGPVHLDLPEDVALAEATEAVPEIPAGQPVAPPNENAITRAAKLIAEAGRPIAVLGASSMRISDKTLLRDFVERNAVPFATTTMAKGLIDEDHPLSLGCIERACRHVQRQFLGRADLIVGIGYDTIEVEYEAWIGKIPLVQIDIEHPDTDGSVALVHSVAGDLDAALAALNALPVADNGWQGQEIIAHREAYSKALRPDGSNFQPHQVIDAVRRALPDDGVLAFDVGAHTHQIAGQWIAHSSETFLITNGWSSMGFGLPAAIAAKLVRPELAVVCVLGDGCFQMSCGEMATAARCGIALPVVVLDDRWLGLIRVKQERLQYKSYGTELLPQEYGAPPAHYFGVPAVAANDPALLEAAVRDALTKDHPTVIEAIINPGHYMETVFD